MPPVKDVKQLKEQAQGRNFLNNGYDPFQTVQDFTQKLITLRTKLDEQPGEQKFAKQVGDYAGALMTLQMFDAPGMEQQLEDAIQQMGKLPNFLNHLQSDTDGKTGYQRLAEAGEKYQVFTKAELDNALNLVSRGMGLDLGLELRKPGEQKAGEKGPHLPDDPQAEAQAIETAKKNSAVLDKLKKNYKQGYMRQREVPEDEEIKEDIVEYLNKKTLPRFASMLGIELDQPGAEVPETGGAPRIFILDEQDPQNPRSLKDMRVETGSKEFWKLAQQGKMFAYPVGMDSPVQVQLTDKEPPKMNLSVPLDKIGEKFTYKEPPKDQKMPDPVSKPGRIARFLHWLNANWYKKEFDDYAKYQTDCKRVEEQNAKQKQEYEQERDKAKQEYERVPNLVAAGAKQAYAAKRTPGKIAMEQIAYQAAQEGRDLAAKKAERDKEYAAADLEANRHQIALSDAETIFGLNPRPLDKYVKKSDIYRKESFETLKQITLPEGTEIAGVKVDDRLFTNLALHAILTPEIAAENYKVDRPKNAEEIMLGEGLSEKEATDTMVTIRYNCGSSDFLKNTFRAASDTYFGEVQQGREKAAEAIEAYKNNNKEPLAEIIYRSANNISKIVVKPDGYTQSGLVDAQLTCELLDLAQKDPELKKQVMEKGLTEKQIETCRGMDQLRQLKEDSLKAEAVLRKAKADNKDLLPEQKREAVHKILKYRTAEAFAQEHIDPKNNPDLNAMQEDLLRRGNIHLKYVDKELQPPEDSKALDLSIATDLHAYYAPQKMLQPPAVMRQLVVNSKAATQAVMDGKAPEPDDLDKLADMTIDAEGLDKLGSAELVNKLIGINGLGGRELYMKQNELLAEQKKKLGAQEKIQDNLTVGTAGVVTGDDSEKLL